MTDNLKQRILAGGGDADALDELIEQVKQEVRQQEQLQASHLRQHIAFQDRMLSLKAADEVRFRATIDKLITKGRITDAENQALRCSLIQKVRLPSSCAQQHKSLMSI